MGTLVQKVAKLKRAGYVETYAGNWTKPSKRVSNWTYVIDFKQGVAVAYLVDQHGRELSDREPVDWAAFK